MNEPALDAGGPAAARERAWPGGWTALGLLLLGLAVLGLHHRQLVQPALWQDDFQIMSGSYTWDAVRTSFWQAHNEHVMPLGRMSTWAMIQLADRPTLIPTLAAWQGPLAVLLAMALLLLFVKRELGHSFYGLVAAALFGVSSQYREAVHWFSASFALLAVVTLLLALLAAQHFQQTGKFHSLAACAVASALAPCWFGSGILAGPFCCLYLLCPGPALEILAWPVWRRLAQASVPLLGTLSYVTLGLLPNLDHIMHLEHWGGKTATQAFQPGAGLIATGHSLVDNLLLGTLGIQATCPPSIILLGLLLLAVLGAIWWRLAPCRRLLVLGLGMILVGWWLIYSARAAWGYETTAHWGRYHLLAHLGLVLFIVGGLPRWDGWGLLGDGAFPVWRTGVVAGGLFAALLASQWARASVAYNFPRQQAELRFIEEMDELCRAEGIPAATARKVLRPLHVEAAPNDFNGWQWLRSSGWATPAEARLLLPAEWLNPQ